jgi:hypothetical protein
MKEGARAKECKWPLEAGKGKEMGFLLVSRRIVALTTP